MELKSKFIAMATMTAPNRTTMTKIIRIVTRKGTAYLLVSTMVAIPYVSIIILFNKLVGTDNIPIWGYFPLLILLAFAFQPIWRMLQRVVDRAFYRERYDALKELEYYNHEGNGISNLERLASSLVKLISRVLQISDVHLLLRSESGDFSIIYSTSASATELTLRSHNPLLQELQSNKGPLHQHDLDMIPQFRSLNVSEWNEIRDIAAELFVPLRTNKDELIGLLVLGEKLSQQPYSDDDKRLIQIIASRIAVELENTCLYTLETIILQELQRQDEQKSEFLHSVAYELKTPLTTIISSSELLSTDGSLAIPSLKERLIGNINRSAWLIDRRVGELLDLANVQIGNLQLNLEPVEISWLTDEMTSQLPSLVKNKRQSLALEIPNSLPLAKADKELRQRVLLNYLSNANKFSLTNSSITLRSRETDNREKVVAEDWALAISEGDKG